MHAYLADSQPYRCEGGRQVRGKLNIVDPCHRKVFRYTKPLRLSLDEYAESQGIGSANDCRRAIRQGKQHTQSMLPIHDAVGSIDDVLVRNISGAFLQRCANARQSTGRTITARRTLGHHAKAGVAQIQQVICNGPADLIVVEANTRVPLIQYPSVHERNISGFQQIINLGTMLRPNQHHAGDAMRSQSPYLPEFFLFIVIGVGNQQRITLYCQCLLER